MAKFIPNARCWVGFVDTLTNLDDPVGGPPGLAPCVADITASTDLTPLLISITANAAGNMIPTPALNALFETSVSGSTQATFTADFYRDEVAADDDAWTELPRGTEGFIIISRNDATPGSGTLVEVWPIVVTSRTPAAIASNTAQTFTVTCSVPREPNESVAITAL